MQGKILGSVEQVQVTHRRHRVGVALQGGTDQTGYRFRVDAVGERPARPRQGIQCVTGVCHDDQIQGVTPGALVGVAGAARQCFKGLAKFLQVQVGPGFAVDLFGMHALVVENAVGQRHRKAKAQLGYPRLWQFLAPGTRSDPLQLDCVNVLAQSHVHVASANGPGCVDEATDHGAGRYRHPNRLIP